MWGLLRLLKPLSLVMLSCILLGTAGFFCAIAITVLGVDLLLKAMGLSPWTFSFVSGAVILAVSAAARGFLRYGEQICGHYIAFRLLAILRDKLFGALRRLAPAKLEGKGKGNLISLITGDIELLEVFYAHTVAPVCIAVLVSSVMVAVMGIFHPLLGAVAGMSYLTVGCVIPLASSRIGRRQGVEVRERLGELNSYFLESLRGIRETLQYGQDEERARQIACRTEEINRLQGELKKHEGTSASWSGAAVTALTLLMMAAGLLLSVPLSHLLLTTVMLSASFGPVLALAGLSATMDQTLAAGERVLALLEELPETEDILQGEKPDFTGAEAKHLSFSYGNEEILCDLSAEFPAGRIIAVTGRSGSGKSTLLRLLMRFWEAAEGMVLISGIDVGRIGTDHLRSLQSYMIQDTDLFHDSIGDNIRIGKPGATQDEVQKAAEKASIHEFIMSLPEGYDTPVGELGDTLSGGERQRIGLARAFLHDAPLLLLDEPTSNLDSLNESAVLKALRQSCKGKTVILVSHRRSTLTVADCSYTIDSGRLS